jgi:hypothetical protein
MSYTMHGIMRYTLFKTSSTDFQSLWAEIWKQACRARVGESQPGSCHTSVSVLSRFTNHAYSYIGSFRAARCRSARVMVLRLSFSASCHARRVNSAMKASKASAIMAREEERTFAGLAKDYWHFGCDHLGPSLQSMKSRLEGLYTLTSGSLVFITASRYESRRCNKEQNGLFLIRANGIEGRLKSTCSFSATF